jgi:hypothetical protein
MWIVILCSGGMVVVATVRVLLLVDDTRLVTVEPVFIISTIVFTIMAYGMGHLLVSALSSVRYAVGYFTLFFSLRLVISILLTFVFQFDDERIHHEAGITGVFVRSLFGAGYFRLVEMLYTIFGANILVPKILNVLIGALMPFVVYSTSISLYENRRAAQCALWLAGLLPPLVLFSGVNLKESVTAFLFSLALWSLVARRRDAVQRVATLATVIVALMWLRGTMWTWVILLGIGTFLIWPLRVRRRGHWPIRWLAKGLVVVTMLASVVLPLLMMTGRVGVNIPIIPAFDSRLSELGTAQDRWQGLERSEATVMEYLDLENPFSPKNLSVLFTRGLFSPSPLRAVPDFGLHTLLESLVMLSWYLTVPWAVCGVVGQKGAGIAACVVMIAAILGFSFIAIPFGGDPFRHRITSFGLLYVLAGNGMQRKHARSTRWIYRLWWLGIIGFTVMWARARGF